MNLDVIAFYTLAAGFRQDERAYFWLSLPQTVCPIQCVVCKVKGITNDSALLETTRVKVFHSLQQANVRSFYHKQPFESLTQCLTWADKKGVPWVIILDSPENENETSLFNVHATLHDRVNLKKFHRSYLDITSFVTSQIKL